MRHNDQRRVERRRSLQDLMPTTPDLPSEGPLSSPPPLLLAKPAIRSRSSLTSLKKMPMIREDEGGPIFINVPNQRPRPPRAGVFYQYGEDYITPWHLVGISPSPAPPRAAAQTTKQGGGGNIRGNTIIVNVKFLFMT
ncbi:hypothetical protein VMCG_03382 [Cytospora schulzeri]|uniref:Uncharacterized protein n=1 Tax=Cytospora schulzeri TaxID=448051 RepID=A0A423WWA1_9PEZI|nr:hypothetical protein VMCG_03382 [Valsa malicola]